MEFSRPEHWSGQPFPSPGDLPNSGIEPRSPALQVDSLAAEPPGRPRLGFKARSAALRAQDFYPTPRLLVPSLQTAKAGASPPAHHRSPPLTVNLFLETHPRWAVPLKNPDQPRPTHTAPDPHSLRKESWCLILNASHHRPQSETKLWRCRKGPSVPHPPRGSPTPHSQAWALRAPAPPLSTGLPPAGLAPRVLLPGGDPGRLHFPKSPEGSTPGSDPLPICLWSAPPTPRVSSWTWGP